MSGFPGRSVWRKENLYPIRCRRERTATSGCVSLSRMRLMFQLRRCGVKLSKVLSRSYSASNGLKESRRSTQRADGPEGLSLLEMMPVVTLILIVASIATPIDRTVTVRAREAVLRDHLGSLRALCCHPRGSGGPRALGFPLSRE